MGIFNSKRIKVKFTCKTIVQKVFITPVHGLYNVLPSFNPDEKSFLHGPYFFPYTFMSFNYLIILLSRETVDIGSGIWKKCA